MCPVNPLLFLTQPLTPYIIQYQPMYFLITLQTCNIVKQTFVCSFLMQLWVPKQLRGPEWMGPFDLQQPLAKGIQVLPL